MVEDGKDRWVAHWGALKNDNWLSDDQGPRFLRDKGQDDSSSHGKSPDTLPNLHR